MSKPNRTNGNERNKTKSKSSQQAANPVKRSTPRANTKLAASEKRGAENVAATARMKVTIPVRSVTPQSVVAHLGPTNSGKTYDALRFLADRGQGVYAAPLRQLAHEAYDKLVSLVGASQVGLRTGEESINASAPILCVTPECAPMSGDTLVLDEVHWVRDLERGWAWTKLLAGGNYDHIRLCGARETEDLIKVVFPDAKIFLHARLAPLDVTALVAATTVPQNWLVVAFSRKAVLAIVGELQRAGRSAGALYGALPPVARREQIRRFEAAEIDVLVCTDVVGHGVNLPCAGVALAEETKFDGADRRALELWEGAQIVGRAGRGPGAKGLCSAYSTPMLDQVSAAWLTEVAQAASGTTQTGLEVEYGTILPSLGDLGSERDVKTRNLDRLLRLWSTKAEAGLCDHQWIRVGPVDAMVERHKVLTELAPYCDVVSAWAFITVPVDFNSVALHAAALVLSGNSKRMRALLGASLGNQEECEETGRIARDVRALAHQLPQCREFLEAAEDLEQRSGSRILEMLAEQHTQRFGVCSSCKGPCRPWVPTCPRCKS